MAMITISFETQSTERECSERSWNGRLLIYGSAPFAYHVVGPTTSAHPALPLVNRAAPSD